MFGHLLFANLSHKRYKSVNGRCRYNIVSTAANHLPTNLWSSGSFIHIPARNANKNILLVFSIFIRIYIVYTINSQLINDQTLLKLCNDIIEGINSHIQSFYVLLIQKLLIIHEIICEFLPWCYNTVLKVFSHLSVANLSYKRYKCE